MKWTLLFCCLFGSTTLGFSQEGKPLTSAEISDRVIKAYGNCESYRDTCMIKQLDIDGKESKAIAKTVYQKGGIFRFEYKDTLAQGEAAPSSSWPHLVLWSDAKEMKSKPDISEHLKDISPESKAPDFRLALQMQIDMTRESSIVVPLIIYPKGASPIPSFFLGPQCSLEEMESIGNRKCYKLSKKYGARNSIDSKYINICQSYWIDKDNFLIIRYQNEFDYGSGKKKIRTLDYQPETNVKLTKEELAFTTPGK